MLTKIVGLKCKQIKTQHLDYQYENIITNISTI